MAILFSGSTPNDLGGMTTENTTLAGRDADFTPVGSKVSGDFDNIGGGFNVAFTPVTDDIWVHFIMETNAAASQSSQADGYWLRFWSGGTEVGRVDLVDDNWYFQGGGQSISLGTSAPNFLYTFDFRFVCDGVNVTAYVYQGGTLQGSFTYASAVGAIDRVSFDHYDLLYNKGSHDWFYSEVMVTDAEPTLGWRLGSLPPAADGFHTGWDGNFNGLLAFGDGASISAAAADLRQSWTLGAYGGPAVSAGVRAVVNKFHATKGATAVVDALPFVRQGGVDYDGSVFVDPKGETVMQILDNNPATGATWDTAVLATLEVGVKSQAVV